MRDLIRGEANMELVIKDYLWSVTKTHEELMKKSSDIFKKLAYYDLLSDELLYQFWDVGKSEWYKTIVFDILKKATQM